MCKGEAQRCTHLELIVEARGGKEGCRQFVSALSAFCVSQSADCYQHSCPFCTSAPTSRSKIQARSSLTSRKWLRKPQASHWRWVVGAVVFFVTTNVLTQYILVTADFGVPVAFGGTTEPAALVTFSSIGSIGPEHNAAHSAAISAFLSERLGYACTCYCMTSLTQSSIPSNRAYILFNDYPGHGIGFEGATF